MHATSDLPSTVSRKLLPTLSGCLLLPALLFLTLLLLLQNAAARAQTSVIYVDVDASGAGDGSTWADAYTSLQDALATAGSGGEIWVAQGVYTPGVTSSARFNLPSGVALYGGFAGDETERDQRDWVASPTVLSGDIGGDDVTDGRGVVTDTTNIVGDNAYHVLFLDGTTTPITDSTRLDGVIVTAGQANSPTFPDDSGGGLYCNGDGAGSVCSPTVSNVTFSGNWAEEAGGAMYNVGTESESNPTLVNVTFSGNRAEHIGGAMYNNGLHGESSPTLVNVTFSGNAAGVDGGAMYNSGVDDGDSSPILTNVTFTGNRAGQYGGAMFNFGSAGQSSPTLVNVAFSGNSAGTGGGALLNYGFLGQSSPTLTNITFSGNAAGGNGGAMYNDGFQGQSSPTLTNVILWENSAGGGAGAVMLNDGATPTIAHSLVQGGWDGNGIFNINGAGVTDGGGNIDADPLFAGPVDPADAPTTAGNLRLLPGSPAIDAGDNDALPPGLSTDLDGNARLYDGDNDGAAVVDIGAYEFTLPLINLTLAPQSVLEDSGQALTVTVTRTRNTLDELTVAFGIGGSATFDDDYTQSGASDFDGSSGTLTFGDGAVTHTLLLTPVADSVVEVDETITISLTTGTNYDVGMPAVVTGLIANDDTAGVFVSPTMGLTTTEGGGADSFTVVLQSEPVDEVTVALSSDDVSEGVASPGTLTFDAGNWQTPQTVTVGGVDDDEIDGDVGYNILLTVSSDDPVYDGIAADGVGVTNLDDEAPLTHHYYLPGPFGHQATAP